MVIFMEQAVSYTGWFVCGSHSECCEEINRFGRRHGRPTTIIVAVGSNNVFRSPVGTTRHRLLGELHPMHNLLQHARIIWSDILLREAYKNEKDPGAGKRVTKDLNKNAKEQLQPVPNAHIKD